MEGNKWVDKLKQYMEQVKGSFVKLKNFLNSNVSNIFKNTAKTNLKSLKIKKLDLTKATKLKLHKRIVNRKRFIVTLGIFAVIVVTSLYLLLGNNAYAVNINGKMIGMVRSKKVAEKCIQTLKTEIQGETNTEISFVSNISYDKTRAPRKEVLDENQLKDKIKQYIKYSLQSYSIYVDGNVIATLQSKEAAEKALDQVKEYYTKNADKSKLKSIDFAEKVEVKQEFNEAARIMEDKEALDFILKGTSEVKTHKIESGESFWSISRKYNMSLTDLQKANPGVDSEKVQIGQVLNLIVPKPLVSVKTVETLTYKEQAPFEQKVEFSSSMYNNETSVKVKGEYGENEITADITKINGVEKSKTVLSQKVLKAPKTQIIVKGTKEPPPKKGTGTFTKPTNGMLSSRFGMRWGRRHEGIDLAAPIGSPVKAADGGVVIFTGYDGGYGNLIKVDHGGGYVTYYGHLSKIYVKKGTKVYKGQKIGAVGSTGNSTGPHLHFEIRKNGVPQNPLTYLK